MPVICNVVISTTAFCKYNFQNDKVNKMAGEKHVLASELTYNIEYLKYDQFRQLNVRISRLNILDIYQLLCIKKIIITCMYFVSFLHN